MFFRRLFNLFYAPYAALVFVSAIPLVCALIIIGPTLAIRRATGRTGVRLTLLLMGVPFRLRGLQHLPAGPSIAVSNHASYLDGLVLTAALPARYTFVVQDGAARWPLVGLTIKRMGVTFVNRSAAREGAAQARGLIRRVAGGQYLTIFAEGTFEDAPGLLPFKNGAFMMAARAGVPIAPCVIRGTRLLWGGGRWLPRWSPVEIEVLPAISLPVHDAHAIHHLRDSVRNAILARCGEPDAAA